MMSGSTRPITISGIARDYFATKLNLELRTEPATVILYRPLSFVLAWAFARAGVHPTIVTVVAGLLNPVILWAVIAFEPSTAIIVISLLGIIYALLDCVDGTLARCLQLTSKLGHYLDFIFDVFHRFVFYAALGYLADRLIAPPPGSASLGVSWIVMTMAAAWCSVFAKFCRRDLRSGGGLLDDTVNEANDTKAASDSQGLQTIAWAVFAGLDQLYAMLGLIAWYFGVLDYYLLWILLVSACDVLIAQIDALRRLHEHDQSHKEH